MSAENSVNVRTLQRKHHNEHSDQNRIDKHSDQNPININERTRRREPQSSTNTPTITPSMNTSPRITSTRATEIPINKQTLQTTRIPSTNTPTRTPSTNAHSHENPLSTSTDLSTLMSGINDPSLILFNFWPFFKKRDNYRVSSYKSDLHKHKQMMNYLHRGRGNRNSLLDGMTTLIHYSTAMV